MFGLGLNAYKTSLGNVNLYIIHFATWTNWNSMIISWLWQELCERVQHSSYKTFILNTLLNILLVHKFVILDALVKIYRSINKLITWNAKHQPIIITWKWYIPTLQNKSAFIQPVTFFIVTVTQYGKKSWIALKKIIYTFICVHYIHVRGHDRVRNYCRSLLSKIWA